MKLLRDLTGRAFPWVAVLAFILIFHYFIFTGNDLKITLIFTAMAVAVLADLVLFNKKLLFTGMLFLIPLSIRTEIGSFAITIPSELLAALFGGIFIIRILHDNILDKRILFHPLSIFLLLDTLWLLITTVSSSMPDISTKRLLIRILFLLVFYLMTAHWMLDQKNQKRLFQAYGLGLILACLLITWHHAKYGFAINVATYVCQPWFADHTIYGAVVAFILPFFIITTVNLKKDGSDGWNKWMIISGLIVILAGTILAYSRAAWLSLFVAAVLYGLLRIRMKFGHFLGLIAVLCVTGWIVSDTVYKKVQENEAVSSQQEVTEHFQSVTNVSTDASNVERINRWLCAWRMFEDRPVFGWGPGTYQFNYGQYQSVYEMTYISTYQGDKGNAHSEYLTYLSESGWPGLLTFLLWVLATIQTGFRVYTRETNRQAKGLALSALLGLTTFFFHGLFNSFIDQDKMAGLVFGSMALLVVLDVQMKPQGEAKST